ncbi:MAG: DUF547 domain-containing protein [Verrucomicrobiia bacterium]
MAELILAGTPEMEVPTEVEELPGVSFVRARTVGRGAQLNAGASVARGKILLFHHIDTVLTPEHVASLAEANGCAGWEWGAFYRKFDDRHPGLRWLEKPERLHCQWFGSIYGDQSMFVRREFFWAQGGFADIPLMEDVEFSDRVRRVDGPLMLDPPIASSPRRHLCRGPWKTTLRNLWLLARYRLGASPWRLHRDYYAVQVKARALAASALMGLLAVLPSGWASPVQEPWEEGYGQLLKKYVVADGVRYEAWHARTEDVTKLEQITQAIAARGPMVESREGRLAYLLNAYNVWMLHEVLKAYPVASVRDIAPLFGVFTGRRIEVAGERMSLNHLEKQRIIPVFKDPRVHFALNCASASCPPLLDEPFTAQKLEQQLERVTRNFLATPGPHAYRLENNRLVVSKIFEWYRKDFEPPGVVPFINRYAKQPVPLNVRLSFMEYDWALNRAP